MDLKPAGGEACTAIDDAVSRVSLASLQGKLVKAYRMDQDMTSTYAVELPSGWMFETEPVKSPWYDETLALAEIDACTMLGVYVDGDEVMRAVVFDDLGNALGSPIVLDAPAARPTLAVTNEGIYLAWWERPDVPEDAVGWDPMFDELWLRKLTWDGSVLDFSAAPIPLPREVGHRKGDQVMPSLTAVPYWPSGAVVAVWNDLTAANYPGQAAHGDVVVELVPTPVLRKGVGE